MSTPENPPAFPSVEEHPSFDVPMHHFGMTLRDWFAGQALAGILATGAGEDDSQSLREIIAEDAYGYADAMLAKRVRS